MRLRKCRLHVRVHAFEEGSAIAICGHWIENAYVLPDSTWIDCNRCLVKLQKEAA
jgi:hypothetical protein